MKRLKDQNKEQYTINDVVKLFNDFVDLNNTAQEKEQMVVAWSGCIVLKDASNTQYLSGVWALMYVLSNELSDLVYTKIDKGVVSINMIKPWSEVYRKAKSVL